MRRRAFIAALGGAAAWPLVTRARAQEPGRIYRLGFLGPTLNNPPAIAQYWTFQTHLEELGFREAKAALGRAYQAQ